MLKHTFRPLTVDILSFVGLHKFFNDVQTYHQTAIVLDVCRDRSRSNHVLHESGPVHSVYQAIVGRMFTVSHPCLEREVFGMKFRNPVGLAAGLDKNAHVYNELSALGFGFIERSVP